MARLFDLPFGYVGTYDDNELEIVSTIRDPGKIRLSVDADKVESNLGCVSFNIRRTDGRHEEQAYVMGRLSPDKQSGAVYIAVKPPGSQHCREVFYADHANTIMRAGRFALVLQGSDGNFVTYDTALGEVGDPRAAICSSFGGRIQR